MHACVFINFVRSNFLRLHHTLSSLFLIIVILLLIPCFLLFIIIAENVLSCYSRYYYSLDTRGSLHAREKQAHTREQQRTAATFDAAWLAGLLYGMHKDHAHAY